MTTKVYRYGLLAPTSGLDIVKDQMRKAHRYYNVLVEIENGRRDAVRLSMSGYADIRELEIKAEVAAAAELSAALKIKSARAKSRTRSETDEDKAALKLRREDKKAAVTALHDRRRALKEDPAVFLEDHRVSELAKELVHSARAHCGVYWGTSQLVDLAVAAAVGATPLFDRDGLPQNAKFQRRSPEGAVGVQLQGGLLVLEAFGEDAQFQIKPGVALKDRMGLRQVRRGLGAEQARTLRLRVDSDSKRKPIFAEWPMRMHRDMPKSARIKKAAVILRMIGPREEWCLTVTVDELASNEPMLGGAVAIDVGWRVIGDEVRVCSWYASDGKHGELRLRGKNTERLKDTEHALSGTRRAEEIQSTRDQNFDATRLKLRKFLDEHRANPDPHAAWLVRATETLMRWKSIGRLVHLLGQWKDRRFVGDEKMFDALAGKPKSASQREAHWQYHDQHLWEWAESQRLKALRHRKDVFRCFASRLAKTYGTLVLERFDLRTFAKRAPVEADAENETARSNRQAVAVSSLRDALKNAFSRVGQWVEKNAAHTTHDCHVCGFRNVFDQAEFVIWRCQNAECRSDIEKPPAMWDQDRNAAINLLARWDSERSGDAPDPVGARNEEKNSKSNDIKESKYDRMRRLRAAKEVKLEAARKALGINAELL